MLLGSNATNRCNGSIAFLSAFSSPGVVSEQTHNQGDTGEDESARPVPVELVPASFSGCEGMLRSAYSLLGREFRARQAPGW